MKNFLTVQYKCSMQTVDTVRSALWVLPG